jgi:hypothetical protein
MVFLLLTLQVQGQPMVEIMTRIKSADPALFEIVVFGWVGRAAVLRAVSRWRVCMRHLVVSVPAATTAS